VQFIQTIEFTGTADDFDRAAARYRELIAGESRATGSRLCQDRDNPGVLVQLVEFDSYDDAMANSNHPATQQWAQEMGAMLSGATYRNLDVLGDYDV
jgi:hypothetical protein